MIYVGVLCDNLDICEKKFPSFFTSSQFHVNLFHQADYLEILSTLVKKSPPGKILLINGNSIITGTLNQLSDILDYADSIPHWDVFYIGGFEDSCIHTQTESHQERLYSMTESVKSFQAIYLNHEIASKIVYQEPLDDTTKLPGSPAMPLAERLYQGSQLNLLQPMILYPPFFFPSVVDQNLSEISICTKEVPKESSNLRYIVALVIFLLIALLLFYFVYRQLKSPKKLIR